MSDRRNDLKASLASVVAASDTERVALERLATLLDGEGDPFDRNIEAPGHVTASAFVLHPDGDRLLLILHRKLQRWLQPGGHVEPSDPTVWDAAIREVEEETGLVASLVGDGPFDVDIHRLSHGGGDHEHFDVRYLVTAMGEAFAGDGVDAVRWASLSELEEMEESLQRPARKALAGPGTP